MPGLVNENRFDNFAPHLTRVLALSREKAQAYAISDILYDNLLDDYDPGTTAASLTSLFSRLQEQLTP